ncbi:MAG: putative quorum-quenching lactonase YtnP [Phycisphaerae bacterium]|nr:putative quorum-quenching lactonase YtnP [Phycisphaerae bacterium]
MLKIGPYEIHALVTGRFRLDGGAMFGVVPKVLWQKISPADEFNRIQMVMRSLVAIDRVAGRVMLVDTGAGNSWSDVEISRYAFEIADDPLGSSLRRLGLDDGDITDIVVTHLHFDHNSGLVRSSMGNTSVLESRFPQARHWIHAGQLQHALSPTAKDHGSYHPNFFKLLHERRMFELLEGETPPCDLPAISWRLSHGHTPCQLLPRFDDGEIALQFCGDLIPTTAHISPAWIMAYDNEPLKSLAEKKMLLEEAVRRNLILFLVHDANTAAVRLEFEGDKYKVKEQIDW